MDSKEDPIDKFEQYVENIDLIPYWSNSGICQATINKNDLVLDIQFAALKDHTIAIDPRHYVKSLMDTTQTHYGCAHIEHEVIVEAKQVAKELDGIADNPAFRAMICREMVIQNYIDKIPTMTNPRVLSNREIVTKVIILWLGRPDYFENLEKSIMEANKLTQRSYKDLTKVYVGTMLRSLCMKMAERIKNDIDDANDMDSRTENLAYLTTLMNIASAGAICRHIYEVFNDYDLNEKDYPFGWREEAEEVYGY